MYVCMYVWGGGDSHLVPLLTGCLLHCKHRQSGHEENIAVITECLRRNTFIQLGLLHTTQHAYTTTRKYMSNNIEFLRKHSN